MNEKTSSKRLTQDEGIVALAHINNFRDWKWL